MIGKVVTGGLEPASYLGCVQVFNLGLSLCLDFTFIYRCLSMNDFIRNVLFK